MAFSPVALMAQDVQQEPVQEPISDVVTENSEAVDSVFVKLSNQYLDWHTFQESAKVVISGDESYSTSVQVKMVKGESILISIRPILGIEVAKVIITNEDFIVLDKINKRYIKEPVALFTNGIDLDISTIQDIILGRPFVLGKGTLNSQMQSDFAPVVAEGDYYFLSSAYGYNGFDYVFGFANDMTLAMLAVAPFGENVAYMVEYNKSIDTEMGQMAARASLTTLIGERALNLQITHRNPVIDRNVEIDTTVPMSYSKMSRTALARILGVEAAPEQPSFEY